MDRAMSVILKFRAFNLAGPHRLFGGGSFENLKVGLLVHGQDHLTLLPQALDSLVIPENFAGPFDSFVIPDGRLPPTQVVRLQVGFTQNVADRRVMNAIHIFLLHCSLSQTAMRPVGQAPTRRGWLATRESFNLLALASGKKKPVGLNAG